MLTAQGLLNYGPTGIAFASVSVDAEGGQQAGVPDLLTTLSRNDESEWVRIATADSGDSYLQWTVGRFRFFNDSFEFTISEGQLVGADFSLNDDAYVLLSFERHTAEQSVTTVTARPVWGELLERGSALGVLDISTAAPTTTGSQEEGTAIIRYAADLAVGTMLTDDLGREWVIDGSRTIGDRRYLEFSLYRSILPAAGG